MSIASKQLLIKQLRSQLDDVLTANDLEKVQDKLNDILSAFDVEEIPGAFQNSDSDDLFRAFFDAKKIEGRSDLTLKRYKYILNRMMKEVETPVTQITVFHLRRYLMNLKQTGMADSTLDGIRSVICTFFGWLTKEGLLKTNPAANLSPIKCQKKVRLPFTDTDIEKLKENCFTDRDKALISFLLATGCRISEVCALNRNSIDFQNRQCTVLGKGNKERTVFFDELTAMYLKRYFAQRKDNCVALFANHMRERITPHGVRVQLCDIGKRAGIENVHPHRFRRTLATTLIDHGMPIQEVASVLGHDKLDTTMTYVYIDRTRVKSSYLKYA